MKGSRTAVRVLTFGSANCNGVEPNHLWPISMIGYASLAWQVRWVSSKWWWLLSTNLAAASFHCTIQFLARLQRSQDHTQQNWTRVYMIEYHSDCRMNVEMIGETFYTDFADGQRVCGLGLIGYRAAKMNQAPDCISLFHKRLPQFTLPEGVSVRG